VIPFGQSRRVNLANVETTTTTTAVNWYARNAFTVFVKFPGTFWET